MADQFSSSVEFGLNLTKRIYNDKGSAPTSTLAMSRSSEGYLPLAPMVYAVISDPATVDNPDIRSYQPYVYGRSDPPALIPLQLQEIGMEIECCLDTVFVTVTGRWRVHCVLGSSTCDCQIAIPMGEQGSLLGVEIDDSGRSYHTELVSLKDEKDKQRVAKAKDGYFLKSQIYTIKMPQFKGGSVFSVKIRWSQKMLFHDGEFSLSIPFCFPSYVTPVGRKISKKEKIFLKVNSGAATEVLCKATSHPLKGLMRQAGKLSLSYEAEVPAWSSTDFSFSYTVSSSSLSGGVLLQSPFLRDFDEREIFCLYLYPENSQDRKIDQFIHKYWLKKMRRTAKREMRNSSLFRLMLGRSFTERVILQSLEFLTYLLKKVGLFPDVLERKVSLHFEKGDQVSALVKGEFYTKKEHFTHKSIVKFITLFLVFQLELHLVSLCT